MVRRNTRPPGYCRHRECRGDPCSWMDGNVGSIRLMQRSPCGHLCMARTISRPPGGFRHRECRGDPGSWMDRNVGSIRLMQRSPCGHICMARTISRPPGGFRHLECRGDPGLWCDYKLFFRIFSKKKHHPTSGWCFSRHRNLMPICRQERIATRPDRRQKGNLQFFL